MNKELKSMFDRDLIGTKYNHPEFNMGNQVCTGISDYVMNSGNQEMFLNHFSRESKIYNVSLREPIKKYATNNNVDAVLSFIDNMYNFCAEAISNKNISLKDRVNLRTFGIIYEKIVGGYGYTMNGNKQKIYRDFTVLNELLPYISDVVNTYMMYIDIKKSYDFSSINIIEKSKSLNTVLTNSDNLKLKNSFSGSLLNGKITVASNVGYKSRIKKEQQDAVLSVVKSDDCYLNIVADGAGGSVNAQNASKKIVDEFKKWFDMLSENELKTMDNKTKMELISNEIDMIDEYIKKKYPGSYSTIVLALTAGDKTIVANIGDSTAYIYDDANDKLMEVTTLDSLSEGLSYEEARRNPKNNVITQSIGDGYSKIHFKVLNNIGERLILSSDGVTDLVTENTFKTYFRNGITASNIVNISVNNPDRSPGISKTEDNVSAIVIDLPDKSINLNQGRRR
ncbi:MAG: protein phosphatase 2C domain-containing protein [Bacilli bacterium]|nr:protein phosphatase 2C domain-containing protein [Bacilli bacterium]